MSGCTARKFPFPPCSPDRIAVPALSQAESVQMAPARIRNLSPREHRTTKQLATSSTTISSYPVSPFRAPPVLGKSVLFIWNGMERHSRETGKTKRETRWGFPFMFRRNVLCINGIHPEAGRKWPSGTGWRGRNSGFHCTGLPADYKCFPESAAELLQKQM